MGILIISALFGLTIRCDILSVKVVELKLCLIDISRGIRWIFRGGGLFWRPRCFCWDFCWSDHGDGDETQGAYRFIYVSTISVSVALGIVE